MIEKNIIKREITCKIDLYPFEGKNYGYYIIIPFTMEESSLKKAVTRRLFWLRIFTSEQTTIEPVKETLMIEEKGEWTETKHCGPMYFKLPPKAGSKDEKLKLRFNPYWCQNPQYFLNIKQPTHMKIILRKDKEMNKKKDKINVGLSICKHFEKKQEVVDVHKPVNARNAVIPDPMVKLLKQTDEHLTPPVLENIERKLLVGEHEDYYESTFGNQELAGLYFHFLPIHGPFVIMPCLSEKSKNNNYTLRIYSDKEIELVKLDETKNVCLVGAWESATSGGCDLFTEKFYKTNEFQSWTKNPKYQLTFENEVYPTKLKVTFQNQLYRQNNFCRFYTTIHFGHRRQELARQSGYYHEGEERERSRSTERDGCFYEREENQGRRGRANLTKGRQ